MLSRHYPDRIRVSFDDHRLVANAGLILPATLALRLGLPELVRQRLDLGNAPGRANTGDKLLTLVASATQRRRTRSTVARPIWRTRAMSSSFMAPSAWASSLSSRACPVKTGDAPVGLLVSRRPATGHQGPQFLPLLRTQLDPVSLHRHPLLTRPNHLRPMPRRIHLASTHFKEVGLLDSVQQRPPRQRGLEQGVNLQE